MDDRQKRLQPHQITFCIILIAYAVIIACTCWDYGITPDETGHIHYGRSVVHWYTTGFAERGIFTWTNTWLYGGIYDAISYTATKISPLDVYDTRHLLNALVGLLGIVVAYRLGCVLGNGWIGCLAALFLILTPRYFGHAFNNHKDIPFAVAYLWSIFCLIRALKDFPNLSLKWCVLTGVSLGITMGIRVGGMLLFFYMVLFFGLSLIPKIRTEQAPRSLIAASLKQGGLITAIAYFVMLLGWPWAQLNPLLRPFQALTVFSQFPIPFINFFEGAYIKSTEIPAYYASKWVLITLPEFVLLGLGAGLYLMIKNKTIHLSTRTLQMGLLAFSTFFPLLYVALTHAALYDAMRHVLFTLPPLVILSALGLGHLLCSSTPTTRYALSACTGLLLLWTGYHMIRLHPNQYTYFNHLIAGGLQNASTQYDTDYLDNSYKAGVKWVEENITTIHPIHLASGTSSTPYLLDPDRFVYHENPYTADIYLITTHLNQHQAVPGRVLHRITANDVPVLYIIRPDTSYQNNPLFSNPENPYHGMISGDIYERANRPQDALNAYQSVLQHDPTFALAHAAIGNILAEHKHTQKAIQAFQKAIANKAHDATIYTALGDCYVQLNNHSSAIEAYQKAIQVRPYYLKALRNLARSYSDIGQPQNAIQTAKRTLFINPNNISDLQLLGSLHVQANHTQEAEKIFTHLKEIAPNDASTYLNLSTLYQRQNNITKSMAILQEGIAHLPNYISMYQTLAQRYNQQGHKEEAAQVYVTALERQPQNVDLLRDLGTLLAEMRQLDQAIALLQQATTLAPSRTDTWYMLGQIYQHQNNTEKALQAYRHILKISPNHTGAQQRVTQLTQ